MNSHIFTLTLKLTHVPSTSPWKNKKSSRSMQQEQGKIDMTLKFSTSISISIRVSGNSRISKDSIELLEIGEFR